MPSLIADSAIAKDSSISAGPSSIPGNMWQCKSTIRFANSWQAAMTAHEAGIFGVTECHWLRAECRLHLELRLGPWRAILSCSVLAVHRNGTVLSGNLFARVFAHAGNLLDYVDSFRTALQIVIPT